MELLTSDSGSKAREAESSSGDGTGELHGVDIRRLWRLRDVGLAMLRIWMDEMVLIEWRYEMMMLPSTRNFNVLYAIANTMPPLYNPPLPSYSSSYWCCTGQR
jgi:hypothetical protein